MKQIATWQALGATQTLQYLTIVNFVKLTEIMVSGSPARTKIAPQVLMPRGSHAAIASG